MTETSRKESSTSCGVRAMRVKKSNNRKILSTILSKIRHAEHTPDMQYMVIYSFLYKYCSDVLKDYLKSLIENKSITLDEAYRDENQRETLKNAALETFGYHIDNPDCYMDEVINAMYPERFFAYDFFEVFTRNVMFADGSNYRSYFNFIFDSVKHAVNFNKFEFVGENHLIVKDIIYSISKLDVFEEAFPFERVFDKVCQSRLINIDHDPDYINHLISAIVSSSIKNPRDVYNPFLNDASSLISLSGDYGVSFENTFAKSQDNTTYCCSLIKLLMNHFDLDRVYCEFGSPFDSFDDSRAKFDVVISRIPPITARNINRLNMTSSPEIIKQNRRKQLEGLLSDKFNMDENSFKMDDQLNEALENLVSKMDLDDGEVHFYGEYAPLKDSEYLFLMDMINSLRDDGVMVVSMSQSFLFKNSLQLLRKYLTYEKNCIDAIISVPDELSRPSRSEIIMIFTKNRSSDDIVFIDMSTDFKTKKEPYAVSGLFKRNLVLDDDTVGNVLDVYNKRKVIEKFSNVVGISEIKENEFNLSISRYVDTFEGEFVNLKDLANDKEKLDRNNEILSEKIEKMMKELDIKFER